MEPETLLQASSYIAMGVAAWPLCKYVIGPLVGYGGVEAIKEIAKIYERTYNKTIEERSRITLELVKAGKNKEEISDILNESFPFPEEPDIK